MTPDILMPQAGEKGNKGVERGRDRQGRAEEEGKGVECLAYSSGFVTAGRTGWRG